MERGMEFCSPKGKLAMINMHSWMFITSYKNLRLDLLNHYNIDSMIHLGPRAFDEIGGEIVQCTTFVFAKHAPTYGSYFRVVEGKNSKNKELSFLKRENAYYNVLQKKLSNIPGNVVGYWASDKMLTCFKHKESLSDHYLLREGIHTADNARFLRLWFEINNNSFITNATQYSDIDNNGKWVPYNKGGEFRKWYGNNDNVIRFDKDSRNEMSKQQGHVRPSQDLYFKEGGTWTAVGVGKFGMRYYPSGFLFDAGGQIAVGNDIESCMAYMNSKVFMCIAQITMPTINFKCGVIKNLPDLRIQDVNIHKLVKSNISISKTDWDNHETSWNFKTNGLLEIKKNYLVTP